jgi:hypothetical protein
MKFKVIQGEKGQKQNEQKKNQNEQNQAAPESNSILEDYYPRGPIHAEQMEKAEGDEDIVDDALKNQKKTGDAA